MIDIEAYLKERNIPTDSLEANSIREGAELMKNKIVESLDKVVIDALEFDTDDWSDHVNYLTNALVKIQDMYEHDNW
jgi:hypothetical protein